MVLYVPMVSILADLVTLNELAEEQECERLVACACLPPPLPSTVAMSVSRPSELHGSTRTPPVELPHLPPFSLRWTKD